MSQGQNNDDEYDNFYTAQAATKAPRNNTSNHDMPEINFSK